MNGANQLTTFTHTCTIPIHALPGVIYYNRVSGMHGKRAVKNKELDRFSLKKERVGRYYFILWHIVYTEQSVTVCRATKCSALCACVDGNSMAYFYCIGWALAA